MGDSHTRQSWEGLEIRQPLHRHKTEVPGVSILHTYGILLRAQPHSCCQATSCGLRFGKQGTPALLQSPGPRAGTSRHLASFPIYSEETGLNWGEQHPGDHCRLESCLQERWGTRVPGGSDHTLRARAWSRSQHFTAIMSLAPTQHYGADVPINSTPQMRKLRHRT